MKFTVNTKSLLSNLNIAYKAVPQKPVLQILGNFLMTVNNGKLHIRACDTETDIEVRLDVVQDGENGTACIDAKFLVSIIKNLPAVPVTLEVKGKNVVLTTPNGKYRTPVIDSVDFPQRENTNSDETVAILPIADGEQFCKDLAVVSVMCGTDDFHPGLKGICIDCNGEDMRMYASDTRRLGRVVEEGDYPKCRFLLPSRVVPMVTSLCTTGATIKVSPRFVEFNGENFSLRCQVIVSHFPDAERVIPQGELPTAIINRQSLLGAIRRISVCSDEALSLIKLHFCDDKVDVSAATVVYDREASESLPCTFKGDVTIGFTSEYLSSVISSVEGEDISVGIKSPAHPAVFRSVMGDNRLFICMPVNIE